MVMSLKIEFHDTFSDRGVANDRSEDHNTVRPDDSNANEPKRITTKPLSTNVT